MWILLLVLLGTPPQMGHTYVIQKYDTAGECIAEGERILLEMQKAYPEDVEKMELKCKPANKIS